ncbi:MAG: MAPEG family protein [Alphaproteobacteria bacterium]|nr:MAPEG family protein [Alphaproteobacteria bacterium]MBV9421260.1 MAPEG family protein [Alphaproteobacteria bacterium]MBV9905500.1 MAPEG family protein [Alphaproteobacteria bacterium]
MHIPAAILSAVVTIIAVVFYFYTSLGVGRMRGKHGIKAPAMTGHEEMDRAVRVHMNTLEQFVIFLPLLWIATTYFMVVAWLSPLLGLVWIIGRFIYMTSYMADPDKRGTGFLIASLANVGLLILSIWGVVSAWMAVNAA